jgi:hypothetical protein
MAGGSEDAIPGRQVFVAHEARLQSPEGVPSGIDRALQKLHDSRPRMLPKGREPLHRASILTIRAIPIPSSESDAVDGATRPICHEKILARAGRTAGHLHKMLPLR